MKALLGLLLFFLSLATCQNSCPYPVNFYPPYNNASVIGTISSQSTGVFQCGSNGGSTYWIQIRPQSTEPVTLSTCNPGTYFNTIISAYVSSQISNPCNQIVCLAYVTSNDASCPNGHGNQVTFYPGIYTNTVFYYVGISGAASGSFNLTISQLSACQTAQSLYPYLAITGNFQNAYYFLPDGSDPCNVANLWGYMFRLHVQEQGTIVVTTCSPDTTILNEIFLYSSTSPCGALSCLRENIEPCGHNGMQVNTTITNLNLYYYAVLVANVASYSYPPTGNFAVSLLNGLI